MKMRQFVRVPLFVATVGIWGALAAADLEFLGELVSIPSSSIDFPQVNRATRAMKAYLEKHGVRCVIETEPQGRELLYASVMPGKEPDFMLSAHLDVVPAAYEGHYALKIDGDRLTGRGVHDNKGMALAVAQTLCKLVGTGASVGCIFGADEEIGGATTTWMVEKMGYRPRKMVIVVDTSYKKLCYTQKGQLMVNVTVTGRSGHSSRPWECDDSLTAIMQGYVKLRAEWDKRHPIPEDKWSDVLTPTVIKSEGTALNRIPGRVDLNLNLRSVNPGAKDELVACAKECFPSGEVTVLRYSPPCSSDPEDPFLKRLNAAMAKAIGEPVPMGRMLAATDARCFVSCGLPTAIIGTLGGNSHGADEWESAASIDVVTSYLVDFLTSETARAAKGATTK